MSGGRGVHNDARVATGFRPGGNLQKGHQLVQAGQRQVQEPADILMVQEGAPPGDLPKGLPMGSLEGGQGLPGVELQEG